MIRKGSPFLSSPLLFSFLLFYSCLFFLFFSIFFVSFASCLRTSLSVRLFELSRTPPETRNPVRWHVLSFPFQWLLSSECKRAEHVDEGCNSTSNRDSSLILRLLSISFVDLSFFIRIANRYSYLSPLYSHPRTILFSKKIRVLVKNVSSLSSKS